MDKHRMAQEDRTSIDAAVSSSCDNEDEEEDSARSQGTVRLVVHHFSEISDQLFSQPVMIRNLPWKIMLMPKAGNSHMHNDGSRSLGFFVQCNGETESTAWSCQASADLKIVSQNGGKDFNRKISHLFFAKENDWGFTHFLSWAEIESEGRGLIKNGTVIFEAKIIADAPHGVSWDSKKHTGYVGLKNQGATCYMNSLLQVLYFTNVLRKAVYKMPTEADDSTKSVGLALQRVFNDLQFSDKAVGTKKLTKSFGWETLDSFMQHDVQEFLRVLLDKLESKMKDTNVSGTIPRLFEGKTISYIRCKNVEYTSTRVESFYDIQLSIKGKRNIMESFRDYVKTENLEGENKYDAESHGLQDAEKGIIFTKFPPVLHLHLMRFQYDPISDSSVKFNDRFEFPSELDLSEFLKHPDAANEILRQKKTNGHKKEDCSSDASEDMVVDSENGPDTEPKTEVSGRPKSDPEGEPMDVDGEQLKQNRDNQDSCKYILHAVLVHSGDNHGGHYVVFINPMGDGKWCKFDDDVVSRCRAEEAIQNNFGGSDDEVNIARHTTNAYMLVYIRKSDMKDILCQVTQQDIPPELTERLVLERNIESNKRKDKFEAHMYTNARIITDDVFISNQGPDLFDTDNYHYQEVRVKKSEVFRDFIERLLNDLKVPVENVRAWLIVERSNNTRRPICLDADDQGRPMYDIIEHSGAWPIYLEMSRPAIEPLLTYNKNDEAMIFFKFYDTVRELMYYIGNYPVKNSFLSNEHLSELKRKAGLPEECVVKFYEEASSAVISETAVSNDLSEVELADAAEGDIYIFQRVTNTDRGYNLPTPYEYYKELASRMDVIFIDKSQPGDIGFMLTLSCRLNYEQLVQVLSTHLNVEAEYLQLFKAQGFRDSPGQAVRCSYDGILRDLCSNSKLRIPKKMYYQRLSMPIHELENKRQMRCSFYSAEQRAENEVTLYPSKNGTVEDVLKEAHLHCPLSANGTGSLRLLEIQSHKIYAICKADTKLENLISNTRSYRIEEIPHDQLNLGENEMIVPVAHFQREPFTSFGTPFFVKVRENEDIEDVKERIKTFLGVSSKEFDKYRIAIVTNGRAKFLEDEDIHRIRLRDLMCNYHNSDINGVQNAKPYIGLQHTNKNPKRARYNYTEKSIKIYN